MPRIFLIFISIFLFSYYACSDKTVPDAQETVVASVGDMNITVSDFRRNYEFGLPHLKKEPDRKRSYLDFMLKEMVLAQQGYRLNLDKSERVRKLGSKKMLQELLIEALFETEVKDKITVTAGEIREAINKSKVQWKMRFWYEPNLEHANRVCLAMREQGYAEVVENILRNNPEIKLKPEYFESKYLTWLEVEPVVLEIIKDLPVGDISDPLKINEGYFIFQIVDIRRGTLTDYDYQERAESFRQILFYRKLNEEAIKYVSAMMTPKNVVTKIDAFKKLSAALNIWYGNQKEKEEDFLPAVLSARESDGPLYALKKSLGQPLVTFEDSHWTIREFLDRFAPETLKLNPASGRTDIRPLLRDNIALEVRNDFMIKEARNKNLHKTPRVLDELQRWKDKWVYEETRSYYTKDLKIDETNARDYFKRHKDRFKIRRNDNPQFEENIKQAKRLAYIEMARARLTQKADSLAGKRFTVVINQAVLDTIKTIDFQKSRWASLQVFKRSNNRMAFPVVDPAWGF